MITVASYGGGVNSTAMLLGLWDRREWPDLVLFADTGGERPETYAYIQRLHNYFAGKGAYGILRVRYKRETLEENCLRAKCLPSIAYGYRKCSQKFKREPQDQFCNNRPECKSAWKRGEKVIKLIGYDAGEPQRAHITEDNKYTYRYPLIEWGWDRDKCADAIAEHGLCVPPKSACFFCPNSSELEILDLRDKHPDLLERALAIERNAELIQIKGLAREYSWQQILDYDRDQRSFVPRIRREMPCECYDGE